jgi:hypothetical protein
MSTVLLATAGGRQPVVLKIARVEQRSRAEVNRQAILNTVSWLHRLGRHPGLVRLHPLARQAAAGWRGRVPGKTYCATLRQWPGEPEFLVMEYLPGGSLREMVGGRPLDLKTALWIAHQLARTLAYIHRHGCVHRDVKPENILFRNLPNDPGKFAQIRPILVDFGVAAQQGELKLVSGSRLWMAPELQEAYERSPLPVDPAWDVYALGLMLCYMISGRLPRRKHYDYASVLAYRERTLALLEHQLTSGGDGGAAHRSPAPVALHSVNHEARDAARLRLQQLITDMLAKEPANRPSTQMVAGATAALLADLGSPLPVVERLRMQLEARRLPLLSSRLQLALVAAVIVAVVLGNLGALLMPWPAAVGAREEAAQMMASLTQTGGAGALTAPPAVEDSPPTQSQPIVLQRQTMPTEAPSPEPTHPPAAPTATQPPPSTPTTMPPTLIPLEQSLASLPPTLIPFTPPATDTPTSAPPTPTSVPPTNTRQPVLAVIAPTATPSRTVRATPTNRPTVRPTATTPPTSTPALAEVALLAPESGVHSDQGKVEFVWQSGSQSLAADHCFELVFWDPAKPADKRSPVGAGRATTQRVDFTALFNSSDPLLRSLIQSHQEFHWGVRIVSCAAPRTVLQEVQQVRVYSYQGQ